MAIKDWNTNYPASLDTNAIGNMEDLVDGADLSRVSQIHSIRDALIAIETEIGTTVPAVGSLRKRVADLEGLVGTDEDAIHDNVADEIHQIALKGTPAGSDVFIIEDGTDSWNKKRITLTSLPGNTLDQAYDEGGAGAGRTISVDSGAVLLQNTGSEVLRIDGYVGLVEQMGDPSPPPSGTIGVLYGKHNQGPGDTQLFYLDTSSNVIQLTGKGYINLGPGFLPMVSNPTPLGGQGGFIFSKSTGGIATLFYMDDAGTVTQITADGYLNTFEGLEGVGLYEQSADPTAKPDKGFVYTKDDGGDTELFYRDDSGNIVQLTQDGSVAGGGVTPLWEWNKTDLTQFPPVPWFGLTVAPGSASLAVDSIAGYPWLRASATFLGPPVRVPDAMVVWPITIPAPAEGNDYIIVADMFQPEDSIELGAGQRVTNFCLFSRFYPTAAPGLVGEWYGYVLRGYDVISGPREARCDRLYHIGGGNTDVMRLGQWIDTAFYGDLNTDYGYGIRAQIGAQGLTNVHHSWSGHRLVPFEEENEGITESNPYYIGDPGIGLHGTSLSVGYPYTLTVYFTNIRVFNFNDIYPVL